MNNLGDSPVSRRNWLGLVSSASVGAGILAAADATARDDAAAAPGDRDLGARIYNIRDYGAKGDGKTLDTTAVQAAIDACNKDQGGTVLVPAGVFAIGTVEIKSNVTLHIAAQGVLLGTDDGKQYHAADAIPLYGDSTLGDGNVGLIFAVKAENVTIEGPGTIDGHGSRFLSPSRGTPSPAGITGSHRPYHLLFHQCRNLTVRDIFLKDSAFHSVRIIQSTFVKLDAIRIYSRVIHNNDGFHFISCEHVHLSNSTIQCQDDACALFGSCKFVTVTNCSFSTRWSVFRFGGGVAENIAVSNCLIYQAFGCPIKMQCGRGSRFENMSFSNLVMNGVTGPISIGVGGGFGRRRPTAGGAGGTNAPTPGAGTLAAETNTLAGGTNTPATGTNTTYFGMDRPPGVVRNISFNGILATVIVPFQLPDAGFTSKYNPGEIKSCIALNAVAGTIENISFNNVHVTFAGGGTAEEAALRDVPAIVGEYYADGVLPAYGLYARNVRGLTMQDVRFEYSSPELRPAMVFDHVEDAAVNGLSAQGSKDGESVLRFIGTRDVLLSAVRVLTPAAVFLGVEGAASTGITVDGGDISKADSAVTFKQGAPEAAVKMRA
jgi:hypothetical protein